MTERYPDRPGHVAGNDTSFQAARSMDESASSLRELIFQEFKRRGPLTCDDVEVITGISHQTCSARIRELVLKLRLGDTGNRSKTRSGRSARLYDLPERIRQQLELI